MFDPNDVLPTLRARSLCSSPTSSPLRLYVTLIIIDGDEGATAQTLDVTVSNVAPNEPAIAKLEEGIEGKTSVNEGKAVNYTASASDYEASPNKGFSRMDSALSTIDCSLCFQ